MNFSRLCCLKCGKCFSVQESALDGVRLEREKIVQIATLSAEGLGIRSTARACGVDHHTVLDLLEIIGPKFEALHNRLVQNIKTESLQTEELWSKAGCSQKNAPEWDTERGDQHTFLAFCAREKCIVSYHTGKRDNYSRTFLNHCHAVALFVRAYNFCKVHSTMGGTPVVALKLATETWTIERLIDEATKDAISLPTTDDLMIAKCGLEI